jgi:hypothetical protein
MDFHKLHLKPAGPNQPKSEAVFTTDSKLGVLWIQDPLNEDNNVTRPTFRFNDLKNLFVILQLELLKNIDRKFPL